MTGRQEENRDSGMTGSDVCQVREQACVWIVKSIETSQDERREEDERSAWKSGVQHFLMGFLITSYNSWQPFAIMYFLLYFHASFFGILAKNWNFWMNKNDLKAVCFLKSFIIGMSVIIRWCDVLSMFVLSWWQSVALPTCWCTSVRALFYCYHTFLDHTTNISRKVHTWGAPARWEC